MQLYCSLTVYLVLPIICIALGHATGVPVQVRDTDELQQQLVAIWAEFQQSAAYDVIDQWGKDWKHVSTQKAVTLNTYCDIACLTLHLPHITTSSSSEPPMPPHNRLFSEPPTFEGMPQTFRQMKEFSISQVRGPSVVTFSGGMASGLQFVFFWDNVNNQKNL